MSRSGQRTSGQRSASRPQQRRNRHANNDGLIPVLARKVREVEAKATDGKKLGPTNRTKFQVIAFLMREERARAKSDPDLTDAARAEQLKRLDGIATILAKTAARDTSLISLLESESPPTATAQTDCPEAVPAADAAARAFTEILRGRTTFVVEERTLTVSRGDRALGFHAAD